MTSPGRCYVRLVKTVLHIDLESQEAAVPLGAVDRVIKTWFKPEWVPKTEHDEILLSTLAVIEGLAEGLRKAGVDDVVDALAQVARQHLRRRPVAAAAAEDVVVLLPQNEGTECSHGARVWREQAQLVLAGGIERHGRIFALC